MTSDTDLAHGLERDDQDRVALLAATERRGDRSTINRDLSTSTRYGINSDGYLPERVRRPAAVLLLLCHLCVWSLGNAPVVWFPRIVVKE